MLETRSKRILEYLTTTRVTDLNPHCLEALVEHLNITDLISLADAHTWLRIAAEVVFLRKYGERLVRIANGNWNLILQRSCINVFDLKLKYQIIRCFGKQISKLHIDRMNSEHLERFLPYISEYCTQSLIEIRMQYLPKRSLNYFTKPMTSVENVILPINFEGGLGEVAILFPKVTKLILICDVFSHNYVTMDYYLPHLEHFEMRTMQVCITYMSEKIRTENHCNEFYRFLEFNPQLTRLKLPFIQCRNFLQKINDCLSHLQNLSIYHFVELQTYPTVHFQYLTKLTITDPLFIEEQTGFPTIPIQCNQLIDVAFSYLNVSLSDTWAENIYTFFGNNPSIRKITIETHIEQIKLCPERLASVLPNLCEFNNKGPVFTVFEIHTFFGYNKSLQSFRFESNQNFENYFTDLRSDLQYVKREYRKIDRTYSSWYEFYRVPQESG